MMNNRPLLPLAIFSLLFVVGCCLGLQEIPREESIAKYGDKSAGSRFTHVDGVSVHYRDEGEGPVLIAIHGFGDSLHAWGELIQGLKEDFRIIRFDIPGNSLSEKFDDKDKK